MDTSLFLSGSNADDLVNRANIVLNKLHTWSFKNYLLINSNKTKATFFRAKNQAISVRATLTLGGNTIEITNTERLESTLMNSCSGIVT